MELNSGALNTQVLNGGVALAASGSGAFSDSFSQPWRIEVRDGDGALVRRPPWWGGVLELGINKPEVLQLTLVREAWYTAARYPLQFWVYEGDRAAPTWKLDMQRAHEHETDKEVVNFEAYGYLARLGRQYVTRYEKLAVDSATVGEVISDLLNGHQTGPQKVYRGYIHPSISGRPWVGKFENQSILQCLLDLEKEVGGLYSVTTSRRLNWTRWSEGVQNEGHRISLGHNAQAISLHYDYTELATRVVAYGMGTDAAQRLTVTKNDAGAQAEYGIITGVLNDQSIRDLDALGEAAQAELDRRKQPVLKYAVSALDLSKTDELDYSFEARGLRPGAKVTLWTPRGLSVSARVLRVQLDLMDPTRVQVHVGNPEAGRADWGGSDPVRATVKGESLEEIIAGLADALERQAGDRGENYGVAQAIDPALEDLGDVVWWTAGDPGEGNLDAALEDVLTTPYGDDAGIDAAQDAVVAAVAEAITNTEHTEHTTIIEALETVSLSLTEEEDRDALQTALGAAELGFTTVDEVLFFKATDTARALQPLSAANRAALDALLIDGEMGYTTDFQNWYRKSDGVLFALGKLVATNKAGLEALLADGESGYALDTHRNYEMCDGVLICVSHLEAP